MHSVSASSLADFDNDLRSALVISLILALHPFDNFIKSPKR